MPVAIVKLGAVAGVIVLLGASAVGAQQQVTVTVAAVPNPILSGSCARIWTDVRDELNRALTFENGVPLQWSSYDYTTSNGTDFEWRSAASGEFELCAKAGAGAVNTQVTATIKGLPYSGATVLTVAAPTGIPAPAGAATAPPVSPPLDPTAQGTVPAQPYVPPAQTYAAPAQPGSPPPAPVAAQPAAAMPPQSAEAQPAVKSSGGFFKKIGSHIKQKAAEVKSETSQNLTAAATQVVDTTFQTGSRLVASTTAEVTNTARMGIGGVGRQLMLAPQRGGANADNLALAIASGRAVLVEMRFAPGTDVLEPSARELARRLAVELRTAMVTTPGAQFVIEGHVDSVPNAQVLSEYRAAAVKAALSSNGVDAKRLIALGYGTSRPLQPGAPATARIEIARTQ
jgi:outer membrane protein OmpA-like peptidoglycan-associated protein